MTRRRGPRFGNDKGQAMAEYAFILAGVALAVAVAIPPLGLVVNGLYDSARGAFGG